MIAIFIGDYIFRRHERCRCLVTYDPADGSKLRQDVHTKKWTSAEENDKIEERKRVGLFSSQNRPYEPDVEIGKSLGAKAKNYDVMDLQTSEMYHFAEGSKIQNVEVFAGKGTKNEYRRAPDFAENYGGRPEDWQHVKGFGVLDTPDGDMEAEVHWSQCSGIGKVEFFIKRWIGE